jgi:hypothetical protein
MNATPFNIAHMQALCGKICPPGAARKGEMHIFKPGQNAAPRGQAQGLQMRGALNEIV